MIFRTLIWTGLSALILALAACSTTGEVASSAGASSRATGYLAEIRRANGMSVASPDGQLERAALAQARYMAETSSMKHTTRFGRDFSSRMRADGVRGPAAENIAHGTADMGRVFQMWSNSPPHRRNMLDPRLGRFGLAYATNAEGDHFWALVLGR